MENQSLKTKTMRLLGVLVVLSILLGGAQTAQAAIASGRTDVVCDISLGAGQMRVNTSLTGKPGETAWVRIYAEQWAFDAKTGTYRWFLNVDTGWIKRTVGNAGFASYSQIFFDQQVGPQYYQARVWHSDGKVVVEAPSTYYLQAQIMGKWWPQADRFCTL